MIQRPLDLQVMASVLRQGRTLDSVSRSIAALTLLWWILRQALAQNPSGAWTILIVAALGFAALQLYWALRVGLDAELLSAVAQQPWERAARDLDASLAATGLRATTHAERSWDDRWRGMRRMLVRQGLCVVAQLVLLAAAGWVD